MVIGRFEVLRGRIATLIAEARYRGLLYGLDQSTRYTIDTYHMPTCLGSTYIGTYIYLGTCDKQLPRPVVTRILT
jgi:hypothetical protein